MHLHGINRDSSSVRLVYLWADQIACIEKEMLTKIQSKTGQEMFIDAKYL
jgi:hypothetical protein